jgi:hypothetical protein
MSYHGIPIPDSVFVDEVKRHQKMFQHHTVSDIARHFRMDTSTGEKVIREILSSPDMRPYRVGIETRGPVRVGRRGASRMAP